MAYVSNKGTSYQYKVIIISVQDFISPQLQAPPPPPPKKQDFSNKTLMWMVDQNQLRRGMSHRLTPPCVKQVFV